MQSNTRRRNSLWQTFINVWNGDNQMDVVNEEDNEIDDENIHVKSF